MPVVLSEARPIQDVMVELQVFCGAADDPVMTPHTQTGPEDHPPAKSPSSLGGRSQ
jgi:hypothetical protein